MFRILIFISLIIHPTYAQERIFKDFSTIHDWVDSTKGVYTIEAAFAAKGKKDISTERAIVILSSAAKAISIIQNGKQVLFLNHPLGTWITQKDQPAPLKISGGYGVYGIMNVDDIIALNMGKTYRIEGQNESGLILEAVKKTTYPYLSLKETPKGYEVLFMDRNRTPVKRGVYTSGSVNGRSLFSEMIFYDLILDTNRSASYKIKSVTPSKVPVSALDPERFKILFTHIKP